MNLRTSLLVVPVSLILFASGAPIRAGEGGNNEIHFYAGGLFGDDLTEDEVSGQTPELDDDVVFGVRYAYNFTRSWAIEGSLGFSPNTATGVATAAGGEIDMDVFLLDVDAVWNFTPDEKVVGYLVFGVGFASADLDHSFQGTVGGSPVEIDDDSGLTLAGGVGAKFFPTDSFMIRVEARYRYIDALVDEVDDALNTVESSVGAGWKF